MAVEWANVDMAAKVEGSVTERYVVQLGPKVELVSVSAAMKAVKQPLGQMDRKTAWMVRGGVKRARAAELWTAATRRPIFDQFQHSLHR